jgi:hypothetical protein
MTNTRWVSTTILLLIAALCVGAGAVCAGILVATSAGFPQLMLTPYNQVENYPFSLNHENCEILIYGDSSTMTGVNPVRLGTLTHRKACNISQTQPTVLATGALPIDLYLKQNALPKYLVIQLAPETFYQPHGLDTLSGFDPIMLMMRHDRGYATTKKLLQNPLPTLRFLSIVLQARYRPNRAYGASFMELYRGPIADYYAHSGFLTLPKPPEVGCGEAKALETPADFGWVEDARKRYSAQGVKVLVLVSPIPECDSQQAIFRELAAHLDGDVVTLPIGVFNDSDRHYTREGAEIVTDRVAQKVLALDRGASN